MKINMNMATETNSAGGSSGGSANQGSSVLTGQNSGAGGSGSNQATNTQNGSSNGAGTNQGGTSNQQSQSFSLPENWTDSLPDDLKSEPSLKVVKDFPTLVKNYVNAQKAIGAEKIPLPGKHATDDDWKEFFQKAGNPKDIKEYVVETPKDVNFQPEFMNAFKENAHKLGVLPKQAQALVNWFGQHTKNIIDQENNSFKMAIDKETTALKNEWGEAFPKKVSQAVAAVKKYGDPELEKFLDQTGLGNNPKMIKLFSKIGETLSEGQFKGQGQGGSGSMTPAEALKASSAIMGNFQHPFHLANHPGHKAAVEEVEALNKMAFPSED